jgi:hypothetical protein
LLNDTLITAQLHVHLQHLLSDLFEDEAN